MQYVGDGPGRRGDGHAVAPAAASRALRLGRVVSQIHARELTTGEVPWHWIDTLTNEYGKDPDVTALMDSTEMWVVPICTVAGN
ncbi:M14 family zinc carboxypeptidase [Streptomyces chattanoogensis]|uniref:M14 family zinc carboxypeptidase n=1 Tax=Streptomyces chattanoogensis TaxID=66876 RepID=UPI001FE05653|nr:M14 family zinc carboxypeptidase [Streptomyces chattanoogensis]